MKILSNRSIKLLFYRILLCIIGFLLLFAVFLQLRLRQAVFCIGVSALVMGILIMAACYSYFKRQNEIMEEAVEQIGEYISGNKDARIECYEDGELYKLFHEVNSLVSILNAHIENEGNEKVFLRNTISDISHQLKTPLAALNIYNGIMQTEAEAGGLSTIREFTDLSEQELDRIETLVQNLLKIAKFDAGSIVMEKHRENVAELMADVERRFSFRAAQEGKELVFEGSEELFFSCDRGWLTEAVGNLVKNALDHTKSGDTVRVEWGQSAQMVHMAVRDTGSGIHPEDLHHIFKRFYRSRYSKDTQGIGLGLPLAKSIVEAHNGVIEADSRPGAGTAFVMNFMIPTKL